MARFLFSIIVLCGVLTVGYARDSYETGLTDSICQDGAKTDSICNLEEDVTILGEIIVEGARKVQMNGDVYYYPDKRQRDYAAGGIDVLRNLGGSELYINPSTEEVCTITGEPVSYYINGLSATKEEIDNLLTQDIKKIELMRSPSNPKYKGDKAVLNFVTVRYDIGGYTKGRINQWSTINGAYTAYSKLAYKNMQYDISLGYSYLSSNRYGYSTGTGFTSEDIHIERTAETTGWKYRHRSPNASFRAVYQKNDVVISNVVGVSYLRKPTDIASGTISFSSGLWENSTFTESKTTDKLGWEWKGDYQFPAGKGISLNISPVVNYYTNDWTTDYQTSDVGGFYNSIKEKALHSQLLATGSKNLGRHYAGIQISATYDHNKIGYDGSNAADVLQTMACIGAGINFNLQFDKVRWYFSGWISYLRQDVDDIKDRCWTPSFYTNLSWQINSKNALNFDCNIFRVNPGASTRSDVLVQMNDIEAIEGSPWLKNYTSILSNISYNYNPLSTLSISPFISMENYIQPEIYVFEMSDYNGKPMIIRHYDNNGNAHQFKAGISAGMWLFNRRLMLQAIPSYRYFIQDGMYDVRNGRFFVQGTAQVNLGDFMITAAYVTRGRSISRFGEDYSPQFYSLSVAYRYRNLYVAAGANNLFNSGYPSSKKLIDFGGYRAENLVYTPNNHRMFTLTATYSFSYGRKQATGNEVGRIGDMNSAALK